MESRLSTWTRRSDLSINRRGVQIISLISAITLTLISLELIETILLNIGVPAHSASDISDLILVILFYGLLIMAGYLLPYSSWKTGSLMSISSVVAITIASSKEIFWDGTGWRNALLGDEPFPLTDLLWIIPARVAIVWCSAVLFVFLGSLLRKRSYHLQSKLQRDCRGKIS